MEPILPVGHFNHLFLPKCCEVLLDNTVDNIGVFILNLSKILENSRTLKWNVRQHKEPTRRKKRPTRAPCAHAEWYPDRWGPSIHPQVVVPLREEGPSVPYKAFSFTRCSRLMV